MSKVTPDLGQKTINNENINDEDLQSSKTENTSGKNAPRGSKLALNLGTKIYGLVGLCLLMMAAVGSISIYQMDKIGKEIESIAERDLPITAGLTKITVHQLEQVIYFERAIRAAEEVKAHPEAIETYKKSVKKFEKYAKLVGKEFKENEKLAEDAYNTAYYPAAKKKFLKIKNDLIALEETYHKFQEHTHEALDYINQGQLDKSFKVLPLIEKESEIIDKKLESLLFDIEAFTAKAALDAEHHEIAALKLLIIVMIAALLISGFVATIMVRKMVSRPLSAVKNGLDALKHGDYEVEVPVYYNDEIGQVAQSFDMLKEAGMQRKAQRAKAAEETKALEATREKRDALISKFTLDIESIIGTVSAASAELNATAHSMADIASRTSEKSSSVSQSSQTATDNVKTAAAASEEMSASIADIAHRVQTATEATQRTSQHVATTSEQMAQLASTADQIGEVVNMISDIAEQTNLLALNATIESARAGEAGKGFSVVASEVKELANQTSKATDEISTQVKGIQSATTHAVESMKDIGNAIEELEDISSKISASMSEQDAATQEIAQSVSIAASGTEEVTGDITMINQASQETETASTDVTSAAGELSQQAEVLKTVINNFIHEFQAA